MFKKLTDFSYKRTGKEAFGFYLAYFFLALVIGALCGAVLSLFSPADTFEEGLELGANSTIIPVITVAYILFISGSVLVKRKLQDNFLYVVLVFISGIFSLFGGALLGLIIPAFLTTKSQAADHTA